MVYGGCVSRENRIQRRRRMRKGEAGKEKKGVGGKGERIEKS